ncbi:septum formation inhibitor Maf [Flagellimonas olearia]|uniref:Septum formation inhibitor Maf n=1 Tax=Flagellimonas olearia TaxID=552546 RepID=A0A6I1E9Y4_9FLAO|nr:septum formation inhibitor Maf [Allomuricauda olearia]KAB7530544.1 septum formation inhibitor Maf [Allomuricauda olearia]
MTPIRATFILLSFLVVSISCKQKSSSTDEAILVSKEEVILETVAPKKPLSNAFKDYWYAGKAEITSYALEQARYGELRDGNAVLIYVTEPFLPEKQVKADHSNPGNVSVLKLNATKNFLTGIYPYSILSSTFYPVHDNQHALKTSLSVQEWCGHVYAQINNRNTFEYTSHSYFEKEADQELSLDKAMLENEVWTKLRINPFDLPIGDIKVIPSLEYLRLRHTTIDAYDAVGSLSSNEGMASYTLTYPSLDRTLQIDFSPEFPYTIQGWTESFKSGFGPNAKVLTTKATKMKSINTAYWGQNSNEDLALRDSLGL